LITDSTLGATVRQIPLNFGPGGGNFLIVSGTMGLRIKVLQFWFILTGAAIVTFMSDATPLTGAMTYPGAGAHDQDYMQLPITCGEGEDFLINLSAVPGGGVSTTGNGILWYIQQ
jgi:hypothetical protein